MSQTIFFPADERGYANHGWLKARHSFSFAGYHDPNKIHFGALRVLNDDIVAPGMGFGTHPHDNMEIITIVLDGALEHKDSMGHAQAIHPNEVQVMSAGTGVKHSEYNHYRDKEVNLLQSWIFPNEKNVTPRYDQRMFDEQERINKWQTLVAPVNSSDDGLKIHQNAWIYRTKLEEGKSITHQLKDTNNGVYIFLIDGKINTEGNELDKRDAIGINDTSEVEIVAQQNSDILLYELPMSF